MKYNMYYMTISKDFVLDKYGVDGLNSSIRLDNLLINELQMLVTGVDEINFDHNLYNKVDYRDIINLKTRLNDGFNRILGDLYTIYSTRNLILINMGGGECRYKLLSLTSNKGYGEM